MQKKKVLIVLADVANGHRSAANAIEKVFATKYPNQYDVKSVDLFAVADVEPFNTSDVSHKLVSQNKVLESLYNTIFQLINTKLGYAIFSWYTNSRMHEVCRKIIEEENPDLVISVHPIISIIMKGIKEKSNKFKSVVVITDLVTLPRGCKNCGFY